MFHTQRAEALAWWNNLTTTEKYQLCTQWLYSQDIPTHSRHFSSLTGREIQDIFTHRNDIII